MGHYSDYYEERDAKARAYAREENKALLASLREFNSYKNAERLSRAGCRELFERIEERVMARLYSGD